jgi:hypothetical protein
MLSRTIILIAAVSPALAFHADVSFTIQPALRRHNILRLETRASRAKTAVRMNVFGDMFQNAMLKLVEVCSRSSFEKTKPLH